MKTSFYLILFVLLSNILYSNQTQRLSSEHFESGNELSGMLTTTNELFFSEYIEGSANNKAFEIYNSGSTTESLSNYFLVKSVNGGGWSQYHTFPTNSSIASGGVWTIAADQAGISILNIANEILSYPSIVHYNGDDAMGLVKVTGSDTLLIDVIGIPDVDPGSAWQVSIYSEGTKDHTLIRKSTITSGNIDWNSSAGTNDFNSEWIVLPQDEFQFLGSHPHIIPSEVTFNVNMSYQISQGNFNPALDYVDIAGNFNNWGTPQLILDDTDGDSIYSATLTGFNIGDTITCKARINGDWNTSELYGLPNRAYMLTLQNDFIDFWYNDEESSNLISINLIQSTLDSLDISSYANDIVTTSGIVTAIQGVGYYLQDGFGAWNGIFVYDQVNTPSIGDLVEITGQVLEYNSLTEFNYISNLSVISSGNILPAPIIISSFEMSSNEAYEGVLVQVQNSTCVDTLNNFGQWRVNDGTGQCVVDDAIFWFNPSLGNTYNVTGVVGYNFGEFRLYPRDINDIIDLNTTSQLTFNVNMSYQISQGNFNPLIDFVDLAGSFNNWGNPTSLMSDIDGDSIYSTNFTGFNIGDTLEFKVRINGDWNTAELYGESNRQHVVDQQIDTINFFYDNTQFSTLTTIYDIQSSIDTLGNSLYAGQTLSTTGIVTAKTYNGYFIQDGFGAWNGIYVYDPNLVEIGDEVLLTCEVTEYYDLTELINVSSLSILSSYNTLPSPSIISTNIASSVEAFEGVLVQVQNAYSVDTLDNFGQWMVNDGSGNVMIDDAMYWFYPDTGNIYNITGVVDYRFGEYKILPRDSNDVEDITLNATLEANFNTMALPNTYYSTGIQNLFPHFCVANTGVQTITSFEVSYSIDNVNTQSTYVDYQYLPILSSLDFDVDLMINYSSPGTHTFTAWITGINGQAIATGDTLSSIFEIITITNPVYSFMSYPTRMFTVFDVAAPEKLVIINGNPMQADNTVSATWYNNQYIGIKNGSDELIVFDHYTGIYTVIGQLGVDIRSITYDNNNDILFGMDPVGSLYHIDPVTAATTLIYQGSSSEFKNLACDLSGNLFAVSYTDDNLYSINPTTGNATVIGYIGFDAYYSSGMSFDLNTGQLYMTSFTASPNNCDLRTLNTLTGASTIIGTFAGGYQMLGLAIPYNNQISTQVGDYAISLDGVDELLTVWGNLPAQENDFTYEAWVYPNETNSMAEIIHWSDGTNGVQFRINGGGTLLYGESGNNNWQYVTSPTVIDTSVWSHIAVTKEGDICSLFINGIYQTSDTVNLNISPNQMMIGGRDWANDRYFNGKIDDVRIWNIARTEAQITADMCASSITSTSLKNRWQFSDGPGSLHAYDEVENRVGILINMEYLAGADCDWVTNICGNTGTILTADFMVDVVIGDAPLSVSFTDLSTGNPTNWSWDFGDGGAGLSQNPTWTYQTPGLYTVSLTIYDINGSNTLVLYDLIEVTSPITNTPNWNIVNTGTSHSILIQSTAPISIDGIPISIGDYIGVFYDSLGTLVCGGFEVWQGSNLAINAWGDDSQTTNPDGFLSNETFTWKIWRASDQTEFTANAVYMQAPVMPNTDFYVTNGMSGLISLEATSVDYQYINLPQGWSYFSTYIIPFEPNIDSICAPFVSNVIIAKDGYGNIYWPQWGVNFINDLIIGDAYQIKVILPQVMEIEGIAVAPELTPVIISQGWSMLGYLRQSAAPLDSMLSPIVSEVIIMKNTNGQTFWPQWSINLIGNMNTGEGYLIKMNSQQILTYPSNSTIYTKAETSNLTPVKYNYTINTGENMTLGIPLSSWEESPSEGSEIGVFSQSGLLVGSGVFVGDNMSVTIWGNDMVTNTMDGLFQYEEFILKVYERGNEYELNVVNWIEGDNIFSTNKISVAGKLEFSRNDIFRVCQNEPNPFSNDTYIKFYTPQSSEVEISIYNILGELVFKSENIKSETGNNSFLFQNKSLQKGTYYYKVSSGAESITKKMLIL